MGYACPVCEDPQADAGHLANHLAFTAITRGGDHEAWLDDRVPEWGQLGESELAERVADHAPDADYPQVFEAGGVDGGHDHGQGYDHGHDTGGAGGSAGGPGIDPAAARSRGAGALDDEARAVLEEAREMTERMRREAADEGSEPAADGETGGGQTGGGEAPSGAADGDEADEAAESDADPAGDGERSGE